MISVVIRFKNGTLKDAVLKLVKRFFPNVKSAKDGNLHQSMTPEYKVIFDSEAMIIFILPKKISKSVVAPNDFIKEARIDELIESVFSIVIAEKESTTYNKILLSYETSLESLTSDDNNSVIISRESDGLDYFIRYNTEEEKINVLVTDLFNKKTYFELLIATFNALENDIKDI